MGPLAWWGVQLRFRVVMYVRLGHCHMILVSVFHLSQKMVVAHVILVSAQVPIGPFDLGLLWV